MLVLPPRSAQLRQCSAQETGSNRNTSPLDAPTATHYMPGISTLFTT